MIGQHASVVDDILAHLCAKGLFGDVTEWCEMRHDCVWVVTCPDCRESYTLVEGEYEALVRRTREAGLTCGIHPVDS